jgi:hypothetical protein
MDMEGIAVGSCLDKWAEYHDLERREGESDDELRKRIMDARERFEQQCIERWRKKYREYMGR